MGCFHSKEAVYVHKASKEAPTTNYHKPKWKSQEPMTSAKLQVLPEESTSHVTNGVAPACAV